MTLQVDRERTKITGIQFFEVLRVGQDYHIRSMDDRRIELHMPIYMPTSAVGKDAPLTEMEKLEVGDVIALVSRQHRCYASVMTHYSTWEFVHRGGDFEQQLISDGLRHN